RYTRSACDVGAGRLRPFTPEIPSETCLFLRLPWPPDDPLGVHHHPELPGDYLLGLERYVSGLDRPLPGKRFRYFLAAPVFPDHTLRTLRSRGYCWPWAAALSVAY